MCLQTFLLLFAVFTSYSALGAEIDFARLIRQSITTHKMAVDYHQWRDSLVERLLQTGKIVSGQLYPASISEWLYPH